MRSRRVSRIAALAVLSAVLGPPVALHAQASAERPAARLPSVTLPPALDRVLRDYERLWAAGDMTALAQLFTDDGFVLQSGRPPVRGRAAIADAYAEQGGSALRLRALAYATDDALGYVIGAYGFSRSGQSASDPVPDVGKFTLTLRREGGRWLIVSDMDNASSRPQRPSGGSGGGGGPSH